MTDPASVLVLAERSDRLFGSAAAIAELLHLEGINDTESAWVDDLNEAMLRGRSLLVLGPMDPDPAAADMIVAFVKAGGGLIAFAPGEALAPKLGVKMRFDGVRHGRVTVPLKGYPATPVTLRGWSHRYQLVGEGRELAPLLDSTDKSRNAPAAVELLVGNGRAIVLACDLTASVYLTRQGDPLLAGCRTTGWAKCRPADLFDGYGVREMELPVADMLCHWLRELLHRAWPKATVLPWLWYFPGNHRTLWLMTSDDDWSRVEQFEQLLNCTDKHRANMTAYLTKPTVVDKAMFDAMDRAGHAMSLHPDLPPPTRGVWDTNVREHAAYFTERFGRPPGISVRNHCITWTGYVEAVERQLRHGLRWDCNYFSAPPLHPCYMTGSGLPIRFCNSAGRMLEAYQMPAQFSDETTLDAGMPFSLRLPVDRAVRLIDSMVRRNTAGLHSMTCFNSHPVSFATYSGPLWDQVLALAGEQGIPVWNVERFAEFWERRRTVRLRPVARDNIAAAPKAAGPDMTIVYPGDVA